MKAAAMALTLMSFVSPTHATLDAPMSAAALAHALDRVSSTGRVLYIAAHPDDENTRLLSYLANQRHVTVAYLSLTRGSGGQNLIGPEQGELLGVIRTEELLAARRIDGARQFFTRARDFGYSKSAEETLSLWGHEAVLQDIVQVLRSFQPDVVITRFDETPPNHGHHTASAILAREAFAAAADPTRFPEQIESGLPPWSATRLLHNLSTWRPVTIPPDAVALDVGGYDPRLGMGFGEIAAQSRTQHKSQGFGRAGERGPLIEHFVVLAGARPESDILDGLELTWARFGEEARPLVAALVAARASLDRDQPEKALPALLAAREALGAVRLDSRVRDALGALDRIIAGSVGLFIRARSEQPAAAPGTSIDVAIEIIARRPGNVRLIGVRLPHSPKEAIDGKLTAEHKVEIRRTIAIPKSEPVSGPHWLVDSPSTGLYRIGNPNHVAQPLPDDTLPVQVLLRFGKQQIVFTVPLVHTWNDRVHGERRRSFLVQPPLTITPTRDAILSVNGQPAFLTLRVRAGQDGARGQVWIVAPEGWSVSPTAQTVQLENSGDEALLTFAVRAETHAKAATLIPKFESDDSTWSFREDTIDYDHIPYQQLFRPVRVRAATLELAGARDGTIGYVEGSGDTVAADLEHVGYRVERIDDATLASGDLSRFAAILVGIRAYNSRPTLRRTHPRLVEYVEKGGNLVVQYQTHSQWDPLTTPIAPVALQLGSGRVTDQKAPVFAADHPLLRRPNRITEADFRDWVQERGLYFASEWDDAFTPLLEMADPNEEPQRGSTLVLTHGKGRYVYTGLAFFRQLPAGVPGAYRLLANLIAAD